MRTWMVRIAWTALLALVGCQFMPQEYSVNAPLRQLLFGWGRSAPDAQELGRRIVVPEGFTITQWASGLRSPRFLRFTRRGDLLVSLPRNGEVALLQADADGDGRSDGTRTLLEGLDRPHGLDLREGWVYVAENGAVIRAPFDTATGSVTGPVETVVPNLPAGGSHWTRTARFGPDGLLYVTVGSDCNACIDDPRRAVMLRFQADGTGEEIYATGLRNAVGFDWRPGTDELYATDNGRDLLGDDFPPCEFNRVVEGGFYGWPFANGDRIPDPDLGAGREREIAASIPPAHGFPAHNAPLGMTFVRGQQLPAEYHGAAIVALHGSWNRSAKDGYSVVSLHFGPDGIEERPFVSGFEVDDDVIGRPVDVAEGPDGALYFSDDYTGTVYRVAWGEPSAGLDAPALAPEAQAPADPLADLDERERARLDAEGMRLYAQHACATCHEAGAGPPGTVPRPLRGLSARHDIEGLTAFMAAPTPPMPAFPLDEAERRSLAVHLLERHP